MDGRKSSFYRRTAFPGTRRGRKAVRGLLTLLARKSLALSRRTVHTAPKTIREKLLSYLSDQAPPGRAAGFFHPL